MKNQQETMFKLLQGYYALGYEQLKDFWAVNDRLVTLNRLLEQPLENEQLFQLIELVNNLREEVTML